MNKIDPALDPFSDDFDEARFHAHTADKAKARSVPVAVPPARTSPAISGVLSTSRRWFVRLFIAAHIIALVWLSFSNAWVHVDNGDLSNFHGALFLLYIVVAGISCLGPLSILTPLVAVPLLYLVLSAAYLLVRGFADACLDIANFWLHPLDHAAMFLHWCGVHYDATINWIRAGGRNTIPPPAPPMAGR